VSEAKEKEKERNLGQCDFLYFVFVRTFFFFYFFAFDICFFSYGQLEAYYVMEISIRTSFSNCVKRQTFGYEHVIWFVKVCGWNVLSMPFWIIHKKLLTNK
jgi:hypothetical protein